MYTLKHWLCATLLVAVPGMRTDAARLVHVCPMAESILGLRFEDATVNYNGVNTTVTNVNRIDRAKAQNAATYSVSSSTDPDFSSAVVPSAVGYKQKGLATGSNDQYVVESWVYLKLPKGLKSGKSYTVTLTGLAENTNSSTFTLDEPSLRSEAIKVSHIGYSADSPAKYAYLSQWLGTQGVMRVDQYVGRDFHVVDASTGQTKYTGKIEKWRSHPETGFDTWRATAECPATENWSCFTSSFSNTDVYGMDFTGFTVPGTYKVVVPTVGSSYSFEIASDTYEEAFRAVMHALYTQRCGIALDPKYTTMNRPTACHRAPKVTFRQSAYWQSGAEGRFSQLPAQATGETVPDAVAWGGYHDAADFDVYSSHLDIPLALLMAFYIAPDKFTDGQLAIPENDNGVPDILDEAAWTLDLFMRLQLPSGACRPGKETTGHPSLSEPSLSDPYTTWYVYGASALHSVKYAATMAFLVECMDLAGVNTIGGPFYGDRLTRSAILQSAINAYDWGAPRFADEMNTLGRPHFHDDMGLALAHLFRATGEKKYETAFKSHITVNAQTPVTAIWPNDGSPQIYKSIMAFAMGNPENADTAYLRMVRNKLVEWVEHDRFEFSVNRGYRWADHRRMPVVVGQATVPRTDALQAAYYVTGDSRYKRWCYSTADYFLGANPQNMCFVAGLGHKSPWGIMSIDSWAYNPGKKPTVGLIPFGQMGPFEGVSSSRWSSMFVFSTLFPTKPGRDDPWPHPLHELYVDNIYSFNTNEFTVHQTLGTAAGSYAVLCPGDWSTLSPTAAQPSTTSSHGRPATRHGVRISTAGTLHFTPAEHIRSIQVIDTRGRIVYATTDSEAIACGRLPVSGAGTYVLRWRGVSGWNDVPFIRTR